MPSPMTTDAMMNLVETLDAVMIEATMGEGSSAKPCKRMVASIATIIVQMRAEMGRLASLAADAERLDALEALVSQQPDRALLLHHGIHIVKEGQRRYAGLGLSNTSRSLRQAIDAAIGKPVALVEIGND